MPKHNALQRTIGGIKLENLRKVRQKNNYRAASRPKIAEMAGISDKTLVNIELGATNQPAKEVLDKILDALDSIEPVNILERHEIMVAFGYQKAYPVPRPIECERAIHQWQQTYQHVWFPAYLVDLIHRLLDWNKFSLRLIGLRPSDSRLSRFKNIDMIDLAFGLSDQFLKIENRDLYLAGLIRTMKIQFQPFLSEPWYPKWENEAKEKSPEFSQLWKQVSVDPLSITMGNQTPIQIRPVPDEDLLLTFQLVGIGFANDPRFTVVLWVPLDEITAIQCLLWKKQLEEK